MTEEAVVYQAMPKSETGIDIADMVRADVEARANLGLAKYGERLQPLNNRDPLTDLYQELLDAVMYLKQVFVEREINSPEGLSCPVCFTPFTYSEINTRYLSARSERVRKAEGKDNLYSPFSFKCDTCGAKITVDPEPSTEFFING